MNWHRWLAALLVMLRLAACSQGRPGPYAPYSPEKMHDRGSGDDSGSVESNRTRLTASSKPGAEPPPPVNGIA